MSLVSRHWTWPAVSFPTFPPEIHEYLRHQKLPGAARFSEKQWVWNGVHSALVRINEEVLEMKVAAPV
jgi:hypothetical protein